MESNIFSRSEMEKVLKEYQFNSRFAGKTIPVKIKCTYAEATLWECDIYSGKLVYDNDMEYKKEILEALDVCGAVELRASFSKEYKDVGNEKWKDWFLEKVVKTSLIPDTNFIYRHYCSSVLAPILGKDFNGLSFILPRMVILEIERRGNEKEKKNVKLSGRAKRESFYAAREIKFIEENTRDFDWLPLSRRSPMVDIANIAGRGIADMQIRREIHQAWEGDYVEDIF